MNSLEIKNLKKSFGHLDILNGINLDVKAGEFLVLVGPSGCGKSTLLRAIAGLDLPTGGEISLNNKNITKLEPQQRDMAMVFQNYALYPHMSVKENMSFSLKIKGMPEKQIEERINEIASLLQIKPLLDRKPKELSGGQRQRVSLGRALAKRSPVILFDEPLSNLDAHLRQQMRIEIKNIHNHFKSTMIYVTHDQTEAMTMGDRIAILNKGNIVQIDTPLEIYRKPADEFVAKFIGTPEINLLNKAIFSESLISKVNALHSDQVNNLGIRPEHIQMTNTPNNECLLGKIAFIENLGAQLLYYVTHKDQSIRILSNSEELRKVGDDVNLAFDIDKSIGFDITGKKTK